MESENKQNDTSYLDNQLLYKLIRTTLVITTTLCIELISHFPKHLQTENIVSIM